MNTQYITVPPDSTGKNVRHVQREDLKLSSVLSDLSIIDVGDTITGLSSGASGTFVGWSTEINTTYIHLIDVSGTFTSSENLQRAGVSVAVFDSLTTAYTPVINIADPNNTSYRQRVDRQGSAYMRFTEGDLPFDAFGHAQHTSPNVVDQHLFTYGSDPNSYVDETIGGGQVIHNVTQSCTILSVDSTSGSLSRKTSARYYPYTSGVGTELLMSIQIGDTGKTGVIRRWGLFDNNDGVYFQLSGSSFSVAQRNSIDNTEIYVSRDAFNGDDLSSTTESEYVIDFSKLNIYFLDFEWLGSGRVRFGVISPSGKRVILHTIENANNITYPYMKRGTLPFRIENFNDTNSASTSQMKLVCASVVKQSASDRYRGLLFNKTSDRKIISGSSEVPILSFRLKENFNGVSNKIVAFAERYEVDVSGSSVVLNIVGNAVLTGSTFTATTSSRSSMEIDTDATSYVNGDVQDQIFYSHGSSKYDFRQDDLQSSLNNRSDGTRPTYTISAKTLDPNGRADVSLNIRWKEVR